MNCNQLLVMTKARGQLWQQRSQRGEEDFPGGPVVEN